MFRSSLLLLVSLAAFTTLLTSCGSTQLASRWTDTPVVANGHDDEWNGMILYQEKEKIGVGIANDNTNLYIVLKTLDFPTQRKIIAGGMTVWLDSTNGNKKNFGIHFPLGIGDRQGSGQTRTYDDRSQTDDRNGDAQSMRERYASTLREIEIIGPGPLDRKRLPVITSFETCGIKVGMSDTLGALIYELIVPLHSTAATPLSIGTAIGKQISVGFETAEAARPMQRIERNEGAESGGGGGYPAGGGYPNGGGMGGGGMGGRGGRGGRGGGMGGPQANSEPLKFWADVQIATPAK